MKTQNLFVQMLLTFAITLVTAAIVTLLWNLLIDKAGAAIDWKTSFLFAIVMGIALPVVKKQSG